MESFSLPSRLKAQDNARQTFAQFSNAVNINGNQTIAKLRMSVDQESAFNGHSKANGETQGSDSRVNGNVDDSDLGGEEEPKTFDMDFFPTETGEQSRGSSTKKPHIFGQLENSRKNRDLQESYFVREDEGYERARRRAAGITIIQKSVHSPLLHSTRNLSEI